MINTSYNWFYYRAKHGDGILVKVPGANFKDPDEFYPIAGDIYSTFSHSNIRGVEVWVVGPDCDRIGILMDDAHSYSVLDAIRAIFNKFYPHADKTYILEFKPEDLKNERKRIDDLTRVSRIMERSINNV